MTSHTQTLILRIIRHYTIDPIWRLLSIIAFFFCARLIGWLQEISTCQDTGKETARSVLEIIMPELQTVFQSSNFSLIYRYAIGYLSSGTYVHFGGCDGNQIAIFSSQLQVRQGIVTKVLCGAK